MMMTKTTREMTTTERMTTTTNYTSYFIQDFIPILLAAGSSTRMGTGQKKEYLPLDGGTVLSKSLLSFLSFCESHPFSRVFITVPEGQEEEAERAAFADPKVAAFRERCNLHFIRGGKSRQESVYLALKEARAYSNERTVVLIHDAARPFVSEKIIRETAEAALKFGAAVPAIPAVDTLKEVEETEDGTFIQKHLLRSSLRAVQTPQAFNLRVLLSCHKKAAENTKLRAFTDDSEIWDAFPELTGGRKVFLTEGSPENRKITYKNDLPSTQTPQSPEKKLQGTNIRIGFGTDLHTLTAGRDFILGGVKIPAEKGELGHSDGDVLLHAISDSLLGASGLGDIGSYFPPEDPQWKDADSAVLLKKIWSDVRDAGWSLVNLDCVLEFEKPKFLPWRDKVIDSIADVLEAERSRIFVKAKTNEKMDAVGHGEAIKAYCTCLLEKIS